MANAAFQNARVLSTTLLVFLISSTAHAQWRPDVKLSTNETAAGLNENMGHCLVAGGDAIHVVWTDAKDKDQAIYYKRSTDKGAPRGADTRISPTPGTDTFPFLAQSGSTLHLTFLRDFGTPDSA